MDGGSVFLYHCLHEHSILKLRQCFFPGDCMRNSTKGRNRGVSQCLLFSFLILLVLPAAVFPADIELTIPSVIQQALRTNFDVQIRKYNPEISEEEIKVAKAVFDPYIKLKGGLLNANRASASTFDLPTTYERTANAGIALEKKFEYGTLASVEYQTNSQSNDARYRALRPEYNDALTFALKQPLLKNRGADVNLKEVNITSNNKEIARLGFENSLIDIITTSQNLYWNNYLAMEELKIRKYSLELASKFLAEAKKREELGAIARADVLQAASEAAFREEEIILSANNVKNVKDRLLNYVFGSLEAHNNELRLAQEPASDGLNITEDELLKIAYERRPDFKSAKIAVENADINIVYTKNQKLPAVDLAATATLNGLSGKLKEGQTSNFTGGYGKALDRMLSGNYYSMGLELTVSFPWGLKGEKAKHGAALFAKEQALSTLVKSEQQVALDVQIAARDVWDMAKRYQAAKTGKEFSAKTLEAEQKKFDLGLSTSYDVLLVQRDFINASLRLVRATTDYETAKVALDKALGMTLERNGFKPSDVTITMPDAVN